MVPKIQIYCLVSSICWICSSVYAVPVLSTPNPVQLTNEPSADVVTGRGFQGTGRVFPGMFNSFLSPFLPLSINVPDMFSGMYSLVNHYFSAESDPRPTTSRRKKTRRLTPSTTTTTETPEIPEGDDENDDIVDLTREESKRLTNEDLAELYQQFLRKKDEFDKLTKKKKKKGKHKHDDMLEKIVSHLAYLELEC